MLVEDEIERTRAGFRGIYKKSIINNKINELDYDLTEGRVG